MGIEAGMDLFNLRTIELILDLFGSVDKDIGPMDEQAWSTTTVWDPLIPRLHAYSTTTSRLGDRHRPTTAKGFDLHFSAFPFDELGDFFSSYRFRLHPLYLADCNFKQINEDIS